MKKILFMIVLLIANITLVSAQDYKWGARIYGGFGTEGSIDDGEGLEMDIPKGAIGIQGIYNFSEKFSIAPSFSYYIPKSIDEYAGVNIGDIADCKIKRWDINADVHWNILNETQYVIYPLAGLHYHSLKASVDMEGYKDSDSEGYFGLNLGVGGQYFFTEHIGLGLEAKYQIYKNGGQFVADLGIAFRF